MLSFYLTAAADHRTSIETLSSHSQSKIPFQMIRIAQCHFHMERRVAE